MGYFQVRYDSRVVIYEHKMFIRLATDGWNIWALITMKNCLIYFFEKVKLNFFQILNCKPSKCQKRLLQFWKKGGEILHKSGHTGFE